MTLNQANDTWKIIFDKILHQHIISLKNLNEQANAFHFVHIFLIFQ